MHKDTARRLTEAAGAAAVAHETAEASRILNDHPTPPNGPQTLVLSVDGAMVPLLHGQWAEARTLAVGEVLPPLASPEGPVIQTTALSYFSRLTDSSTFADQALPELHRRGIETAGRVGAVVDGAEWCQSFIDLHYPEAVRILDFPHAAEYITAIGQTQGPSGPLLVEVERTRLCHALKHDGPAKVLTELRELVATLPNQPDLATQLAYLEKRQAQLQYPQFVAEGWPIGSGMVESANKLVVEDRLKGAGMHWAEWNVNPMLALRNAVCNDRWDEVWTMIEANQRRQVCVWRQERRQRKHSAAAASAQPAVPASLSSAPVVPPSRAPASQLVDAPAAAVPRPAATHPWKRPWSIRRQRELAGAA